MTRRRDAGAFFRENSEISTRQLVTSGLVALNNCPNEISCKDDLLFCWSKE
jgi:hypothetical protein